MPIPNKSEIDELVDSEGGVIDGDRNAVSNSEIETGPVDKPFNDTSDYEKGLSTTTDRASRYRQNIPWFAVYSYGSTAGRGQTVSRFSESVTLTKEEFEKSIEEDLVKKSKSDRELFDAKFDGKVEKIIDAIEDNDLSKEQLNRIKKIVLAKLK